MHFTEHDIIEKYFRVTNSALMYYLPHCFLIWHGFLPNDHGDRYSFFRLKRNLVLLDNEGNEIAQSWIMDDSIEAKKEMGSFISRKDIRSISYIDNSLKPCAFYNSLFPGALHEDSQGMWDFVYPKERFTEFTEVPKRRHSFARFVNEARDCSLVRLEPSHREEALELLRLWSSAHDDEVNYANAFKGDCHALDLCLKAGSVDKFAVTLDGGIKAILAVQRVKDILYLLYCKTDVSIDGLNQYLLKSVIDGYNVKKVNYGCHGDIPGLMQYKTLLKPSMFVRPYRIDAAG
jgi:hypothetical protein